jgi:hypothetical protein
MTNNTTLSSIALMPGLKTVWLDMDSSFDHFCLVTSKGFRHLNAHMHLPALRAALIAHQAKHTIKTELEENLQAA